MGELGLRSSASTFVVVQSRVNVRTALIVADEPRRSSRANKGSNSDRWQEVLDSARHNFVNSESVADDTATDAGTIQTDHLVEDQQENADDRIRCVCGQTEEVEDEDKDFVQCDQCSVWQHNQCVGLPSEIPENEDYFCERCRPDLHEDLLKKLEKSKVTRRAPKAKATNKRKRQSVKGNGSDMSSNYEAKVEHKTARSSIPKEVNQVEREERVAPSPHATKSDPSSVIPKSAKSKASKASNKKARISNPSAGPYSNLSEIEDPERKKIASALIRLTTDAFKLAIETEGFPLRDDMSIETEAQTLGLQIEFAMFDARLDVRSKFRQLSFNLKDPKNPSLRRRVLDRSLKADELVHMSSEDMANPELKAKTEALREESLKQSVLVQESGPRIRRTHKGEEYVEAPDASMLDVSESSTGVPRVRERDGSSSPASIKSPESSDDEPTSVSSTPLLHRRERSNSNFDIKDIWTHIESPSASNSPEGVHHTRRTSSEILPLDGDDNDDDILGLLEGDAQKPSNSYNYSRTEAVWEGQVLMPSISDLEAKATLLGGPKQVEVDWSATLTSCIQVDGRIPKPDATKYLCHQKFSQSKAVHILRLDASQGKEGGLKTLYSYFLKKDRYGVIKPGKTRLRDGYIVPLPADATLPEFITMLPSFNLPAERTDMLLAVLVLEKTAPKSISPLAAATSEITKPTVIQSPVEAHSVQQPPQQPAAQHHQNPAVPQWQNLIPQSLRASQSPAIHSPSINSPLPAQQQQPQPQPQYHRPANNGMPDDPYARRAQMSRPDLPVQNQATPPIHLDQNAQAILGAFLRANPAIANNPQVIASPQLMGRLLEEFVNNGGMNR
ncbi:Predicted protein [Taphrina deformans PYCC 5710]|uniref:Transcription factor BYE1 n=1 Tax=Taphrina deformans (strain PYCC 5710 / ATCC 11124 / CBS 356.35 / IMI 108563 / JCM 9778 / NBRC 8474) TaxID=1097556 RepID=R4XCY0_TAPDE|nr:Predicted protein [Taphrina deformans PYCC 5710]|eukprot:CCG81180.1 Predicted protein [Taphrina deformans PYCC 5710]